ncbi:MAG: hypothetical protein HN704_18325 [Bacteroidetes bacterium]|jgi:hypothetical protein|nr:hypothetical protein [Bacteroidota bacterium]MBT7493560.1 hypothetical protein [Bacteroidota bacterium]
MKDIIKGFVIGLMIVYPIIHIFIQKERIQQLKKIELKIDLLQLRFDYIADSLKFSIPAVEIEYFPQAIENYEKNR